jgi:hypothetical protein
MVMVWTPSTGTVGTFDPEHKGLDVGLFAQWHTSAIYFYV